MQEKTGRLLTWILLSAAAFGQLLIFAAEARESSDLIPGGKSSPFSYIDIRMYGDTAGYIGLVVGVLVLAAAVVCFFRGALLTLAAILASVLASAALFQGYFPENEHWGWPLLAGAVLLCLGTTLLRQHALVIRRRQIPDDTSSLTEHERVARKE